MPEILAYFITVSAYGNRVHGDDRGSVDRDHNLPGTNMRPPEPGLAAWERQQMRATGVHFDPARRACIEQSLRDTCEFRGWILHAVHCRTNHWHAVVSSTAPVDRVTHDLKAYATRSLRRRGLVAPEQPVWARSASMRRITSERALAAVVHYTFNAQGEDLDGTIAKLMRDVWDD